MSALYESPVLQAVAYPPTVFFVPTAAFGLNVAGGIALWLLLFITTGLDLVFAIFAIGVFHVFLVSLTVKDPHLESMAKAVGFYFRNTPNIIPSKNRRYVP